MNFSDKISALMRERGLTQDALGKALEVTHRAVGGWLAGAKPHRRKAVELAKFLDVPLEVLLDDNQELPHRVAKVATSAVKTKISTTGIQPPSLEGFTLSDIAAIIERLPPDLRSKIVAEIMGAIYRCLSDYLKQSTQFQTDLAQWLVGVFQAPNASEKLPREIIEAEEKLKMEYPKAKNLSEWLEAMNKEQIDIESPNEIKHRVWNALVEPHKKSGQPTQ